MELKDILFLLFVGISFGILIGVVLNEFFGTPRISEDCVNNLDKLFPSKLNEFCRNKGYEYGKIEPINDRYRFVCYSDKIYSTN